MFFRSKRLIIRKFSIADLDALSALFANKEVMHFSLHGRLSTLKSSDSLGYAGLMSQSIDGEDLIELGDRLDPKYWGKGLASEAANMISRYAFDRFHLDQIIAIIDPKNTRSVGAAFRIGMRYWKDSFFHNIPVQIYVCKRNS